VIGSLIVGHQPEHSRDRLVLFSEHRAAPASPPVYLELERRLETGCGPRVEDHVVLCRRYLGHEVVERRPTPLRRVGFAQVGRRLRGLQKVEIADDRVAPVLLHDVVAILAQSLELSSRIAPRTVPLVELAYGFIQAGDVLPVPPGQARSKR